MAPTAGTTSAGSDGNNALNGRAGADFIVGDDGNDTITGGLGKDTMFGGSTPFNLSGSPTRDANVDNFVFASIADSGRSLSTMDEINFFEAGTDNINLSAIDARAGTTANESFTFIGLTGSTVAANGVGGRVAYYQSGGDTYVGLEVTGDTRFDSIIKLEGLITLNSADFIL